MSVPRANGMFVSPDGGVAQLGATVTARVTAVTTPASPALQQCSSEGSFHDFLQTSPGLSSVMWEMVMREIRRHGVPVAGLARSAWTVAGVTACSSSAAPYRC
jgi:hypothetical protein